MPGRSGNVYVGGDIPTCCFGITLDCALLEEDILVLQVSGLIGRDNEEVLWR